MISCPSAGFGHRFFLGFFFLDFIRTTVIVTVIVNRKLNQALSKQTDSGVRGTLYIPNYY